MRNGTASLLFSLLPLHTEGLAYIAIVRSSMPSSTCCAADALGVYFLMTYLPGKLCIIIFASGGEVVCGSVSIRSCESGCVFTGARGSTLGQDHGAGAVSWLSCLTSSMGSGTNI